MPFGTKRQINPKPQKIDESALAEAELHSAKAAGLVAGASKILTDFIGDCSWGYDSAIPAAIQLLYQAQAERTIAKTEYDKASFKRKKK